MDEKVIKGLNARFDEIRLVIELIKNSPLYVPMPTHWDGSPERFAQWEAHKKWSDSTYLGKIHMQACRDLVACNEELSELLK